MIKFLRRCASRYSKLGAKRKKKQKWNRPKGRDNKMREKRKGYPAVVSIGYRKESSSRGLINGKKPIQITKLEQIEKIKKDEIAIIGRVGKKRRLEIAEKAKEKNIEIQNLNPKRFLRKNENSKKKTEEKLKSKQGDKKESKEK